MKLVARVRAFFDSNISEIVSVPGLALYGAFLALIHALSASYMFLHAPGMRAVLERSTLQATPFCWPYFPACHLIRIPGWLFDSTGFVYLSLSIVIAMLFCFKRVQLGYYGLLFLSVFKLAWFSLDYRYMGNYHYMPLIVTTIYLFFPQKSLTARCMIVLFYLSSAFLKLNNDWLSAGALFGSPGVSGILLEWMCAYVVVLEMLFAFGLLAELSWLRWATLAQFVIFHLYSFRIVGYFYPGVMISLLTIFPINWLIERRETAWPIRAVRRPAMVAFTLFFLAQLIPHFKTGDPALRGEGRFFALNLFDSNTTCTPQLFLKHGSTITEIRPSTNMAARIHCDPLVLWNYAREQCRKNENAPGFQDLDVTFSARRLADAHFTPLVAFENFCRRNPPFNVLWPNEWML